jgi:hypothetical protein
MRILGTFFSVIIAGVVFYTVLIPAALVLALVALLLGMAAAILFVGMVLSFIGWLVTNDPAALSATAKCAVWGSVAFLPSFVVSHYIAAWWFRPPSQTFDAPFEDSHTPSLLALRDGKSPPLK